jgi:hypothetical protein
MTTDSEPIGLHVAIEAGDDADADALDRMARQLLSEVREVDVEQATLERAGSVPAGAKSAEALNWGAVAIAVLPAVLPKVIEVVTGYIRRQQGYTIKIRTEHLGRQVEVSYDPSSMKPEDAKQLVEMLLSAQSDKPRA